MNRTVSGGTAPVVRDVHARLQLTQQAHSERDHLSKQTVDSFPKVANLRHRRWSHKAVWPLSEEGEGPILSVASLHSDARVNDQIATQNAGIRCSQPISDRLESEAAIGRRGKARISAQLLLDDLDSRPGRLAAQGPRGVAEFLSQRVDRLVQSGRRDRQHPDLCDELRRDAAIVDEIEVHGRESTNGEEPEVPDG